MRPAVHVIGAGLSGLSTALSLSALGRFDVVVHERGSDAGGRRRVFFDAADGAAVDSVATVVWPHWRATRALISSVGAEGEWRRGERRVDFLDLQTNARWTLRPGRGLRPWWALWPGRRAPDLVAADDFRMAAMARGAPAPAAGRLAIERLWRPLALAAHNLAWERAAPELLRASLREALAAPALAPLYPRRDLGHALLAPLQQQLRRQGVTLRFERELKTLTLTRERVATLEFGFDRVELGRRDAVALAVPPWVAAQLVPGLLTPDAFTATITAHFAAAPPPRLADLTVLTNGPFHALLRREDGLCVVARDAGGEIETPREALAAKYWATVAAMTGLADAMPAWRLVKQRRAAFAATAEQHALRPEAATAWANLALAGGYVRSDQAETLEGAIRSGERAAALLAEAV